MREQTENVKNIDSKDEEIWNLEPVVMERKDIKKKRKKSTKILLTIAVLVLISLVAMLVVKKILPAIERNRNMEVYRQEGYIEQDVTRYLEERYGEEFVIESIRGRSYAYDYVNIYAYPKEHQEEEAYQFKIQGRYNENGILEYADSYIMIKLRDEYEAYIDPIIDKYFDDYKFYMDFNSEWITSNISADAELEDLWELSANVDYPLPDLAIFLKSSQKSRYTEQYIKNMSYELAKGGYRGTIHIACYELDEFYERKNNENKRDNSSAEMNNSEWHVIFVYDENNIDYR